jgi:hypothetical protein
MFEFSFGANGEWSVVLALEMRTKPGQPVLPGTRILPPSNIFLAETPC